MPQPLQWPMESRDQDPMPTHHPSCTYLLSPLTPLPHWPLEGSMAGGPPQRDVLTLLSASSTHPIDVQADFLPIQTLLKVTFSGRPPGAKLCSTANGTTIPPPHAHSIPLSCFLFLLPQLTMECTFYSLYCACLPRSPFYIAVPPVPKAAPMSQ